ncbi:MAG: hypothetical protein ACLFRX_06730 [Gemmatimonadota bacterium]
MTRASRNLAAVGAALILLLSLSAAAAAQVPKWDAGWGPNYMTFAPFVEADSDVIARDLGLDSGVGVHLHSTHWLGARRWFGLRLSGFHASRPLELPTSSRQVGIWGFHGSTMIRPFVGPRLPVVPFLAAGAGWTWFHFGDGPTVRLADSQVVYSDQHQRQFNMVAGGGIDIYPGLRRFEGTEWGLRLEVADLIMLERPFEPLQGTNDELSHNLVFSLSFQAAVR